MIAKLRPIGWNPRLLKNYIPVLSALVSAALGGALAGVLALALTAGLNFVSHRSQQQSARRDRCALSACTFRFELVKNLRLGFDLENSYFVASYALRGYFDSPTLLDISSGRVELSALGIKSHCLAFSAIFKNSPRWHPGFNQYRVLEPILKKERERYVALLKKKEQSWLYLDRSVILSLLILLSAVLMPGLASGIELFSPEAAIIILSIVALNLVGLLAALL